MKRKSAARDAQEEGEVEGAAWEQTRSKVRRSGTRSSAHHREWELLHPARMPCRPLCIVHSFWLRHGFTLRTQRLSLPATKTFCRLHSATAAAARLQARQQESQQRAPRLPVRAPVAGEQDDGEWVAEVQPRWDAVPAVPAVQGITVVDDLAAELERQRQQHQQEQQAQQQQQQREERQRQADGKQGRPASKQRPGTCRRSFLWGAGFGWGLLETMQAHQLI